MKFFRILCFLVFAVLSALVVNFKSASAAEMKDITSNIESTIKDSDLAVKLPNGGYVIGDGTATITEEDGTKTEVNAKTTNFPVMTIKEMKEDMQRPQKTPRRDSPPTSVLTLDVNEHYVSSNFSGSGWRYGGYYFKPINGSGDYLLWETYVDAGRAGDGDDLTHNFLQGWLTGMPLSVGHPKYVTGIGYSTAYFTFNPKNGTHYMVSNS